MLNTTAYRRFLLALALLPALLTAGGAAAFDLQGHRGARGLAPENTLAGFARAVAVGVHTLELDVGISRDGVVVVMHDARLHPDIARDTDGRWVSAPGPALADLTLAELRRHDVGRLRPGSGLAATFAGQRPADGERVPTLDEVLAWVKRHAPGVRLNVETKLSPLEPALAPAPEAFAKALLEVVERHDMVPRVSLQSFDWRTLDAMRRLAPAVRRVALTNRSNWADPRWTGGRDIADHGTLPRLVKAADAHVWSPRFDTLDAAALAEAHTLGLRVVPWTVNEPAQIERMLALGVDGLISDRPDLVRQAMAARGMALPPSQ